MSITNYDTTGADRTVLQQEAYLLANTLANNEPFTTSGPASSQARLLALAKAQLPALHTHTFLPSAEDLKKALITSSELTNPITAPLAAAKIAGAITGTKPATAAESWLASIAGNWGLIIVGVILGMAALIISQHDNITKIVNTGKDVAEKVATVAAVAA